MYEYRGVVTNVVDGDTFDVVVVLEEHSANLGFNINEQRVLTKKIRVRLSGIDTPETWRPKTDGERAHGEECTQFVKNLIDQKEVMVKTHKVGASIYGRYDADVNYVVGEGETMVSTSLKDTLLENGFAKRDDYV